MPWWHSWDLHLATGSRTCVSCLGTSARIKLNLSLFELNVTISCLQRPKPGSGVQHLGVRVGPALQAPPLLKPLLPYCPDVEKKATVRTEVGKG